MATAIPDREERIKNAISFFASEHRRLTRRPLGHTFLYKYLAFFDFAIMEKTGHPSLGLLYSTRGKGPSPIRRGKLKSDRFIFLPRGEGRYIVTAAGEPDLSCFSPSEANEMRRLVETYAHRFAKAYDSGEGGYKETGFWRRARSARTKEGVGYDDVFDDDFFIKYKEAYEMSSLRVLIEKYVTQMKELEGRIADTKHKLEIVMEASRLLAEEGLADEYPSERSGEDRTYQKDR